jgi:hypothetical protein
MKVSTTPKRAGAGLVPALGLLAALLGAPSGAGAQALMPSDLVQAALQGFGDRHNSHAWGVAWWRDHLYVGTGRSTYCIQQATTALFEPELAEYPGDPEAACTPDPHDLPLAAEIWRWSPVTDTWEMLYRSPVDIPIQGTNPVKYAARDIGYRGMLVFREQDGTEALYVSGVSSRANLGVGINGPVPPPRILRSTDGVGFEPLPQDPGTVLGDTMVSGFRNLLVYKGKMYVLGSVGLLGHGIIFEATHPEQGNDAFRQISPPGKTYFEIETYNGHLYAGTGVQPQYDNTPWSLWKTDATGNPYTFSLVIPEGAYRQLAPGAAVISMQEFKGRLYVGTERELLRVNPDDSWDLVVGTPRTLPDGRRLAPLSGFDFGFDYLLNFHMWRMAVYQGSLLVGTNDIATKWRDLPGASLVLPRMGADIYSSADGWNFTMVTRTGFGDIFDSGIRTFTNTPHGLFVGTANHWYGTRLFRTITSSRPVPAPTDLAVENVDRTAVLSWTAPAGVTRFHVHRDTGFEDPVEIATVDATSAAVQIYRDTTVRPGKNYHYFVVAEEPGGTLSGPSPMLRYPYPGPTPTAMSARALLESAGAPAELVNIARTVREQVRAGRLQKALGLIGELRARLPVESGLPAWRVEDLDVILARLARRIRVAQAGALPAGVLLR